MDATEGGRGSAMDLKKQKVSERRTKRRVAERAVRAALDD